MTEDDVILLSDHRWIEVGSDEWRDEIMNALNDHTDRLLALEEEGTLNNLAPKMQPLFIKHSPDLYGDQPDSRYIYIEPLEGRVAIQVRQKNADDSSDVVGEISLLTRDALSLGKYLLGIAEWTPTLD